MKKLLLGILFFSGVLVVNNQTYAQALFIDDFEKDLSKWELVGAHAIQIKRTDDPTHKHVLQLQPDGRVYALMKDSGDWDGVSVEGEVLFPENRHSYLGLIYNYTRTDSRVDFGSIYIKGNSSYIRVNPHRDGNVSRLLYEEYKTPLTGDNAINIRQWQRFKAEIMANVCHFYVGDMRTPRVTFGLLELNSGLIGFKPRIVGAPVWVDNIKVFPIDKLSYQGDNIPRIEHKPDTLITDWEVIGPLPGPIELIERSWDAMALKPTVDGVTYTWQPFQVDARGAVITGKITEYLGRKPVAYFRTRVHVDEKTEVVLHITTIDEMALFVNGQFEGFIYRDGYVSGKNDWNAWFDFWSNPEHEGRRVPVELKPGENQIVVRIRNGQYASGGFFARLEAQ